jgi:hypothetical protein
LGPSRRSRQNRRDNQNCQSLNAHRSLFESLEPTPEDKGPFVRRSKLSTRAVRKTPAIPQTLGVVAESIKDKGRSHSLHFGKVGARLGTPRFRLGTFVLQLAIGFPGAFDSSFILDLAGMTYVMNSWF